MQNQFKATFLDTLVNHIASTYLLSKLVDFVEILQGVCWSGLDGWGFRLPIGWTNFTMFFNKLEGFNKTKGFVHTTTRDEQNVGFIKMTNQLEKQNTTTLKDHTQ